MIEDISHPLMFRELHPDGFLFEGQTQTFQAQYYKVNHTIRRNKRIVTLYIAVCFYGTGDLCSVTKFLTEQEAKEHIIREYTGTKFDDDLRKHYDLSLDDLTEVVGVVNEIMEARVGASSVDMSPSTLN